MTARTRITDVATVGIPVVDQDRALAFYRDQLGFEIRMDGEFGGGRRWIEVAAPGSSTSLALVQSDGDRPSGIDTGIRLATGDAAADHRSLRERGVDVDAEVIPVPVPMFVFRDPDGNRLYVVERPATA
ncbi:MAG TPA: VOC family protein [Candidatus Limnocylindrales bacterium]|jgi:predicted enzyme related to lactoylglutathione lyase